MLNDNNQNLKMNIEKECVKKCEGFDCDNYATENVDMVIKIRACKSCAEKLKQTKMKEGLESDYSVNNDTVVTMTSSIIDVG